MDTNNYHGHNTFTRFLFFYWEIYGSIFFVYYYINVHNIFFINLLNMFAKMTKHKPDKFYLNIYLFKKLIDII